MSIHFVTKKTRSLIVKRYDKKWHYLSKCKRNEYCEIKFKTFFLKNGKNPGAVICSQLLNANVLFAKDKKETCNILQSRR